MAVVTVMTAVAVPARAILFDHTLLTSSWCREDDYPGVDDSGYPAQTCEKDVEEEVQTAACTEKDCERWEEHGDYAFADAALGDSQLETLFRKGVARLLTRTMSVVFNYVQCCVRYDYFKSMIRRVFVLVRGCD